MADDNPSSDATSPHSAKQSPDASDAPTNRAEDLAMTQDKSAADGVPADQGFNDQDSNSQGSTSSVPLDEVKYFVFDIETVADGQLIADVRYPTDDLTPADAMQKYINQISVSTAGNSTFIPHTFQQPIAVAIAKVDAAFRLRELVSLDEPNFRPHVMTQMFWEGWEAYKQPTWVTFNGRGFDIPVMELSAYRFGIGVENWFRQNGASYTQPRNRYNTRSHLDLQDLMTNFSAVRFNGGLNAAAKIIGRPGKMDVKGDEVQELYDAGELSTISDYCRSDVLDTYFVFLRCMVLTGKLPLKQEQHLVHETEQWLAEQSDAIPAYANYLARCKPFQDPFQQAAD